MNCINFPVKIRTILFACVLVLFCVNGANLCAQSKPNAAVADNVTHVLKGSVTDENGMPVPGVKIINSAANVTTVTNMDGNFEIAAFINDTIEVNFHDAVIQNIKVTNFNKLNVLLTTAQVEQQKTLASYPVTITVGGSRPLKFAVPDPNFFSSLFQYVSQKVK